MKTGSFYSATDKALFDALCQHKITKTDIANLMFSRGIIVSSKTEKEDLARDFSTYIHGYEDYDQLASVLGSTHRRERSTSYNLETKLNIESVEDTMSSIKQSISDIGDKSDYKITHSGNRIELNVSYQECNFSKSEMQQISNKDAVIIIEKDGDDLRVRSPSNNKMEEIHNIIIDVLEKEDKDIKRKNINLTSVASPETRSKFFTSLISTMKGYILNTVTDVYVFNPNKSGVADISSNEVHITSASLKGKGVTLSSEIKDLYSKGFYIWKIVWQATKVNKLDSDNYEFEAQFSNPEEFKQFSYLVKGSYKKKEIQDGGTVPNYNSNRTSVLRFEEDKLNSLIEKTAIEIIEQIFEDLSLENGIDEISAEQVVTA
jgi:hypothetical protein